ncbi:hypothetical protein V6N12_073390 [Hibiscus sabdariffa]|uniref:Uncharacterized protein n=1 Tax=Hibiscus sabdariffa TaxID=183260 RepID=A0ABR2BT68_9ROSI
MYDISCLGSKRSETLFAKARVKQRSMITLFIQATAKIRLVFSNERKLEERVEPGGKAQVLIHLLLHLTVFFGIMNILYKNVSVLTEVTSDSL